jgi:hypothetical protein
MISSMNLNQQLGMRPRPVKLFVYPSTYVDRRSNHIAFLRFIRSLIARVTEITLDRSCLMTLNHKLQLSKRLDALKTTNRIYIPSDSLT